MCCNVLDSIGGAESYRVSVSCVGSPANVQGFDSVPAPQSQKNLHRFNQTFTEKNNIIIHYTSSYGYIVLKLEIEWVTGIWKTAGLTYHVV